MLNALKPINTIAAYYQKLINIIQHLDYTILDQGVNIIKLTWLAQKQIICFGNGGSALTAQHYINDWNKNIYQATKKQFLGRCLTENIGLLTSYANDIHYHNIFVEQLRNILQPGDLVIGISGSGNSENVTKGIEFANEQGNLTLGLCGFDGGKLNRIAQYVIHTPIHDMQIVEDIHFTFGHLVMQSLCQVHLENEHR
jgi:D-sedoheptulose 7-phosphate isomerase